MSLSNRVAANLPYLRRYARALTGSQESGDTFVRATLQASLDNPSFKNMLEDGRTGLYRAFTIVWAQTHKDTGASGPDNETHATAHEAAARRRLSAITPLNRQALLLMILEEFSTDQAAEILGLRSDEIGDLVQDAIGEIDHESATNVLIIEDEPLPYQRLGPK